LQAIPDSVAVNSNIRAHRIIVFENNRLTGMLGSVPEGRVKNSDAELPLPGVKIWYGINALSQISRAGRKYRPGNRRVKFFDND
jgi:hypothetical protein